MKLCNETVFYDWPGVLFSQNVITADYKIRCEHANSKSKHKKCTQRSNEPHISLYI